MVGAFARLSGGSVALPRADRVLLGIRFLRKSHSIETISCEEGEGSATVDSGLAAATAAGTRDAMILENGQKSFQQRW